jgi:LacI family transcriptional regulator
MARPTIHDLAKAAGVSTATISRITGGIAGVRPATIKRVRDAAAEIGFYGLGAIESRLGATRDKYRFGVLLQQPNRTVYHHLAQALRSTAETITDCEIDLHIEFLEELSPQHISSRMLALGETCKAIGVVAGVHPLVTQAIETLQSRGVPVFAIISQLAATGDVHYVGLDNWKLGRTAAWAMEKLCRTPGKLGILVGNYRYRCQEMNEAGFRSYFREYPSDFTLLEALSTFESTAVGAEMTERLLREHPDLVGLFVAGGGLSGALDVLRSRERSSQIMVIGLELVEDSRTALLDGTLSLVISHPLGRLSEELLRGMIKAVNDKSQVQRYTCVLPFDISTRENI